MHNPETRHIPLTQLDEPTCWNLLKAHSFGRLALRSGNKIDILVVKYALYNNRIYFQSRAGESFRSIVVSREVAFEIDEARSGSVKSVTVYGQAQWYPYELPIKAQELDDIRLANPADMNWVEVIPESISGHELKILGYPGF